MKQPSKSAEKLSELIKKAIEDHKVTGAEYRAIVALAEEDNHIDDEERALLRELHELIANGTVVRAP